MTAQDVINLSLGACGIVNKYQVANTNDSKTAFSLLNAMLSNWAADGLISVAQQGISVPLQANKYSYTIGTGQNVNVVAPYEIKSASLTDNKNNVYDSPDIIGREEYYAYEDRLLASGPCEAVFYDRGITQASPQIGTLFTYPVPDASTIYTLLLQCMVPFTQFVNFVDNFTFPDYYQEAFWSNLAIRCAAVIGGNLRKEVPVIADKSYKNLTRMNSKKVISSIDVPRTKQPSGGGYNIYTDQGG